ncbi:hypothetical protein Ddc_12811 [Ditylenchus destructor]|nr:hypothetical protein Ddc_12811 [Ditylenchus destructor]
MASCVTLIVVSIALLVFSLHDFHGTVVLAPATQTTHHQTGGASKGTANQGGLTAAESDMLKALKDIEAGKNKKRK